MSTAKLSIVDLTKRYAPGMEPAVDQLNMEVEHGHLIALLGPSGCGKTTTLRMVAGLMDPTSGSIIVDGKNITNTPVHRRGMGMVFQSYALFPHMNVAENVAFGLKMRKVDKASQATRVTHALEMVKLDHLAKRHVKDLSGGQQQRIALARALVVEPTVLLLDEPLSNLDAKLRGSMRTEIRAIQQRTKATTLFVTHDQDEALDMADRIAVMNGGRIEQFGAPMEIYERPSTRFVADFIGRANLIDVHVDQDVGPAAGGERAYRVLVAGLGARGAVGRAGLEGSRRTLLVRPHSVVVELGDKAGADADATKGTVTGITYTGDAIGYRIAVEGFELSAEAFSTRAGIPRLHALASVAWDPSDAYLLPAAVED